MSKDILDKLVLKNTENLSDDNFKETLGLGMSLSQDKLKTNDDFSNGEQVRDEHSPTLYNRYVALNEILDKKVESLKPEGKINLNALPEDI